MLYSEVENLFKNNEYNNDLRFKHLEILKQQTDWDELVEVIYPHYIKSKIKNLFLTVESMLRIYILTRCFDMSPFGVIKALSEFSVFREFALIDLNHDVIPEISCIENFSSLFKDIDLATKMEQTLYLEQSHYQCSIAS